MKTSFRTAPALALLMLLGGSAPAVAASFGGAGLLAMAGDDARNSLVNPVQSTLVEISDGGGSAIAAAPDVGTPSGSGASAPPPARAAVRAQDPARYDPSAPAAETPRRPSYRWQSLIPGAIK